MCATIYKVGSINITVNYLSLSFYKVIHKSTYWLFPNEAECSLYHHHVMFSMLWGSVKLWPRYMCCNIRVWYDCGTMEETTGFDIYIIYILIFYNALHYLLLNACVIYCIPISIQLYSRDTIDLSLLFYVLTIYFIVPNLQVAKCWYVKNKDPKIQYVSSYLVLFV